MLGVVRYVGASLLEILAVVFVNGDGGGSLDGGLACNMTGSGC